MKSDILIVFIIIFVLVKRRKGASKELTFLIGIWCKNQPTEKWQPTTHWPNNPNLKKKT